MRADRVVIEPFAYDSIGELEIKKEIGSHATARVSGILERGPMRACWNAFPRMRRRR